MMRILLIVILTTLTFITKLNAQSVGISTGVITPDASSIFEVQSTAKGILIPRVSLTRTNVAGPIANPATSLLVYNTGTSAPAVPNHQKVTPGYYYNDGTPAAPNWTRLMSGKEGWLITGNYGTDPTSNWLGTNDAQPLIIRTNNIERARIVADGNILVNYTTIISNDAAFTSVVSPTITTLKDFLEFKSRTDLWDKIVSKTSNKKTK
jgi:hypothetical protein